MLSSVSNDVVLEEHTWKEAHKSNKQLSESNKKPDRYDEFWTDYLDGGYRKVLEKYHQPDPKGEKKTVLVAWKRAHEYLLPPKLRK